MDGLVSFRTLKLVLHAGGHVEKVLAAYADALRLDPRRAGARLDRARLGFVRLAAGQVNQARRALKRAQELQRRCLDSPPTSLALIERQTAAVRSMITPHRKVAEAPSCWAKKRPTARR